MVYRFLLVLFAALGTTALAQPCSTTPSLSLVSRTANSITVSTGSTATYHRLEYGPLGFTPGSGTLTPWFTGNSYTINSLSGSTGYDLYVRDSCTNGNKSNWSSYVGYATTCQNPASIPWFENFDNIHFLPRTSNFPPYFSVPSTTPPYLCGWIATPTEGYAWISAPPFQSLPQTGPQSDHSGRSKYLFADRFGTLSGNSTAIIRTPQINLTGATVPVVEFWYHMYGNQIDSLIVEASAVGNPNWVRLGAIPANPTQFSAKTSPWVQQIYPLTMFVNQTVTVRFVAKSSFTFPSLARVAIDDIRVGQATGCVAPSNLNFSGIQATSVVAGLVNGASTHHQLSYGAVGTGAGNGSIKRFSGTSTTLTGLTPNTTYEAWVRDSCSATSFSNWVGPVQFTTGCLAVPAPWSESFDGFSWVVPAFNQPGTWPSCWDRPTTTGMTYLVGPPQFSSFNTGPSEDHGTSANGKFVFLESVGFTNGTSGTFKTPWINLSPIAVPELTFWYHAYGSQIAGTQLHIEDTAGVFTQVWSSTGQIQTAQTDPWTEITVSLAAYANKKVRLRWTGNATGNFAALAQAAIDDIDIHATPTCPKPQNVAVTTTNSSSATLSWTVGSSPWVIKYGPVGFNPSLAGTRVVATSNPFTVTGLAPSTTYQFYVKDTCGPTSVSAWSTPVSGTTTCTTFNAPYSETFQSAAWTVGVWPTLEGTISPCWSRSAGTDATDFFWTVGQGPMQAFNTGPNQGVNGGKYLFTSGFGSNNVTQATVTSPWINTTPLNVPMLRFSSHLFAGTIDKLQVFVDSGTGWQSILVIPVGNQASATAAWTLHELQLPAYADNTIRFRFRGEKTSTPGYAEIGLDEFAVVEAPLPSCSAPSALIASGVTVTTAQIGFTAGGGSTRIALGPAGFVPTNAAVVGTGITTPHILTGLTANTTYHVYLKDTCAAVGLASSWIGPLAFTTQPCPAVTANFTYAVVGGNLIMNAQNISATSTYAWTLLNSSGGIVATRTGGSSTISVTGTGSFTLSLIVTNYCGQSDTAQVTVNICAPLGGGFSHTVNGNTVTFTSLAVNSAGQLWDFGDGNQGSGSNPSHTYAGSGSYTVIMRSYNICGDTIASSQVVTTCSKPTAEWTAQILSSGGAGMRVQFNATPWSSADAVSFQWLYGDGTTGSGANPIKVYGVPGLFYNVTLIATNSCGGKDTLTKSLQTVGLDEGALAGAWFPNPAQGGQWITSPSDAPVSVATLSGQVLSWAQRLEGGKTQVRVPEDCPSGVYVVWQDGVATRIAVP